MNALAHAGAHAALVACLGMVAVLLGGPLVTAVFRRVDHRPTRQVDHRPTRQVEQRSPAPSEAPAASTGSSAAPTHPSGATGVQAAAAQLRGGAWIGALERLAIYAGLMAHYPEAIAICLAMKGLARYPELKAPSTGAAERFIIGTFVSVLWACACAGVATWGLGRLP